MPRRENVSEIYRTSEVETQALGNALARDRRRGVRAPSPNPSRTAAESTLLNLLGLLDSPTGGAYWFFGEDVARRSESQLTRLRREHIGFVFQSFNLIDDLTVAEERRGGAALSEGAPRRAQAAGAGRAGAGWHRPSRRPSATAAFRRPAAAGGGAAGAGLGAEADPRRRTRSNLDTANGEAVMAPADRGRRQRRDRGDGARALWPRPPPPPGTIKLLDGRVVSEGLLAAWRGRDRTDVPEPSRRLAAQPSSITASTPRSPSPAPAASPSRRRS